MANVEILGSVGGARSCDLLDRVFALGGRSVMLEAVKVMCRIDPRRGGARLRELAAITPEPDRSRLVHLGERLVAAGQAG